MCCCLSFISVQEKMLSHVYLSVAPMDCSLPATSVHGISQARILEWLPFPPPGFERMLSSNCASWIQFIFSNFFYLSKQIANTTSSGSFLSLTIPIKMNHSFFWVPIDSVFFKASGQNLLVGLEINSTWPASWEICMQVRKQQLELDMEQQTGSK